MYSTRLNKVYSRRAELCAANDLPGQKEANGMFLSMCLISRILMSCVSDETFSSDWLLNLLDVYYSQLQIIGTPSLICTVYK
jgi:hypothetical protein